jgi:hypothetical protein
MKPWILFLAALLLVQGSLALAATQVYMEPQQDSVASGTDYIINVKINTDQKISGYMLSLSYDARLSVTDVSVGDFFSSAGDFKTSAQEEEGILFVGATESPVTGAGMLGTVTFHANLDGPSGLSVQDLVLLDEDGNDVTAAGSFPVSVGGCATKWNCTMWTECSGGVQTRTCTDLNGCVPAVEEDQPCGGSDYHGSDYQGFQGVVQEPYTGNCTEGLRTCGNGGVVECIDGRLVEIEECESGCDHGFCLNGEKPPTGLFADPASIMYAALAVVLIGFGCAIVFYGLKG